MGVPNNRHVGKCRWLAPMNKERGRAVCVCVCVFLSRSLAGQAAVLSDASAG